MKADEYRKMTLQELEKEYGGLMKNVYNLKCKMVTDRLDDISVLKKGRRDMARIITIMKEKKNEIKKENKQTQT